MERASIVQYYRRYLPEFCKDGSDLSKHYNAGDFKDRHTEKIVEMLGIEHSMWGEDHIKRCLYFSVGGNDIIEPAGGFHGPSPNGPVCLINGGKPKTVDNMKIAHCELSHEENKSKQIVRANGMLAPIYSAKRWARFCQFSGGGAGSGERLLHGL